MHNAAFVAATLDWSYIPFRADAGSLPALFGRLRRDGLVGGNFTYPCKEAAASLCDELSAEAELLGAVNAVRVSAESVEGFNTDVAGCAAALDELAVEVGGRSVLVLGAGAAARACGLALAAANAAVTFASRDVSRPRPGVSPQAAVIRLSDAEEFVTTRKPALLINATPIGLSSNEPALFDYAVIPDNCFVLDLNYGRPTVLLAAAKRRGLRCADGRTMLLWQGARAFELWTGVPPPVDVMRRALATELRKREL